MQNFPGIGRPTLSPLSRLPSARTQIVGIEENYLKSVMTEYYLPTDFDRSVDLPKVDGKDDMVFGLFSREGNQDYDGKVDQYGILANSYL